MNYNSRKKLQKDVSKYLNGKKLHRTIRNLMVGTAAAGMLGSVLVSSNVAEAATASSDQSKSSEVQTRTELEINNDGLEDAIDALKDDFTTSEQNTIDSDIDNIMTSLNNMKNEPISAEYRDERIAYNNLIGIIYLCKDKSNVRENLIKLIDAVIGTSDSHVNDNIEKIIDELEQMPRDATQYGGILSMLSDDAVKTHVDNITAAWSGENGIANEVNSIPTTSASDLIDFGSVRLNAIKEKLPRISPTLNDAKLQDAVDNLKGKVSSAEFSSINTSLTKIIDAATDAETAPYSKKFEDLNLIYNNMRSIIDICKDKNVETDFTDAILGVSDSNVETAIKDIVVQLAQMPKDTSGTTGLLAMLEANPQQVHAIGTDLDNISQVVDLPKVDSLTDLPGLKNLADKVIPNLTTVHNEINSRIDSVPSSTPAAPTTPNTPETNTPTTPAKPAASSSSKKTLKHNAAIYNKNGKRIGKKVLKKGTVTKILGSKVIKGHKYYVLGKGRYIKVINFKGLESKLSRNAYIYNKSAKRVGKKVLKKGRFVKTFGSRTIKGKRFASIGRGQYIKAANLK